MGTGFHTHSAIAITIDDIGDYVVTVTCGQNDAVVAVVGTGMSGDGGVISLMSVNTGVEIVTAGVVGEDIAVGRVDINTVGVIPVKRIVRYSIIVGILQGNTVEIKIGAHIVVDIYAVRLKETDTTFGIPADIITDGMIAGILKIDAVFTVIVQVVTIADVVFNRAVLFQTAGYGHETAKLGSSTNAQSSNRHVAGINANDRKIRIGALDNSIIGIAGIGFDR